MLPDLGGGGPRYLGNARKEEVRALLQNHFFSCRSILGSQLGVNSELLPVQIKIKLGKCQGNLKSCQKFWAGA